MLLVVLAWSCAGRMPPLAIGTASRLQRDALADAGWHHAMCYFTSSPVPFSDIPGRIRQCKDVLLSALPNDDELVPLHDYFKAFYPTAGEALRLLPDQPMGHQRAVGFRMIGLQRDTLSDRVFEAIAKWVTARLDYSTPTHPIMFDLVIESSPGGAQFTLRRTDDRHILTIDTKNPIPGVFVGHYKYVVEREGYKPHKGELNLVDWKYTHKGVMCVLTPLKAPRAPSDCIPSTEP